MFKKLWGLFFPIASWIPLGIAVTAVCSLIYISAQQNYRQSANDPQIQIAQDLKESLDAGKSKIEDISGNIDLNKSLANFVIIYGEDETPLASSASLDGHIPSPPKGVFEAVRQRGSEWFTWQPKVGVREATVLVKYSKGFILAGRSLKEIENREDWLFKMVLAVWIATLVATLVAHLLLRRSH